MKGWIMRISRYGHACVRIERARRTLVIDPGTWSDADALIGADAGESLEVPTSSSEQ